MKLNEAPYFRSWRWDLPPNDREVVVFVDTAATAHVAFDWAALIRRKCLAEYIETPTHRAPGMVQ